MHSYRSVSFGNRAHDLMFAIRCNAIPLKGHPRMTSQDTAALLGLKGKPYARRLSLLSKLIVQMVAPGISHSNVLMSWSPILWVSP